MHRAVGRVGFVHVERGLVGVLDVAREALEVARVGLDPFLDGAHIVLVGAARHARHHVGHEVLGLDLTRRVGLARIGALARHGAHHARHVYARLLDGERVLAHRGLLGARDVVLRTVRERQDERDADDADRAGKRREERAALLGHEVGEAERDGARVAHGALALLGVRLGMRLDGGLFERGVLAGVAVAREHTVLDAHDAVGVFLGELRVVRDHDHEAVAAELLQDLHDLNGGLRVEGARGLVGEDDLGVVDDRAGDGHALHLSARKLVGLFVEVVAQAHTAQGLLRAGAALGLGCAREQKRHLDVGDHALVRDEVVALEDEAHAVVAIGVPVLVAVAFGGAPVDDEVARGVLVQAADDVEQRRLAAARLPQHAHELAVAERDVDALERVDDGIAGRVVLGDAFEF